MNAVDQGHTNTQPALEVIGLKKAYGGLKVTDDVNLVFNTGEIHAVIGPNGAGKTTLVRQICGELTPDRGKVFLDGQDITHLSVPQRAQRGLGRTFQITSILPRFSAAENVAVAIQSRAGSSFRFFRPARWEKNLNDSALAVLERVGLLERAGLQAAVMSHGEQRRLEIAMALALEPKMLLLDEPLAGAGPEDVATLIDLLRNLRREVPVLLIDHDMEAVFSLADRVSVLARGKVIATGTPDEIREDPTVVSSYLGEDNEDGGADA